MPRSRNRPGSRRTTRWIRFLPSANSITAATPEATAFGLPDTTIGGTILRVVGSISWIGLTVDTAAAYFPALIVAPNTMDAADMDPAVNTDLDYLYWSPEGSRNPAYDGVDSFVEHPRMIDIRGRRKIREGDDLFFCENATGTNVTSFVKLSVLFLNP